MTPEIAWRFYPLVANHPAARAFVESLAKRQHAAKTIDAYARNLEDFPRTWPGASPERVLEADAADLDDYLAQLYTRFRARASRTNNLPHDTRLSDATVQRRLVTLRLFYDFCLQRGLRQNPISPVRRGQRQGADPVRGLLPRRRRLPWIPTDDEWRSLLADLCPHRLACLKCRMFVGGTAAELLEVREGVLRLVATVPMNPEGQAAATGDAARLEERLNELRGIPPPTPPSEAFIFNPTPAPPMVPRSLRPSRPGDRRADLTERLARARRDLAEAEEAGKRTVLVRALRKAIARWEDELAALPATPPPRAEGSALVSAPA